MACSRNKSAARSRAARSASLFVFAHALPPSFASLGLAFLRPTYRDNRCDSCNGRCRTMPSSNSSVIASSAESRLQFFPSGKNGRCRVDDAQGNRRPLIPRNRGLDPPLFSAHGLFSIAWVDDFVRGRGSRDWWIELVLCCHPSGSNRNVHSRMERYKKSFT